MKASSTRNGSPKISRGVYSDVPQKDHCMEAWSPANAAVLGLDCEDVPPSEDT
jgi:hypothetical protein